MTINNMTIRIGGAAGDGVESSGVGFCQALARGGLHVFGLPDYYSRIRGGHNFFSIRVSNVRTVSRATSRRSASSSRTSNAEISPRSHTISMISR